MDSQVSQIISREAERQSNTIELIASENHVSSAVTEAVGSCLTNKYAEGYPGKRYYFGCDNYLNLNGEYSDHQFPLNPYLVLKNLGKDARR